MVALLETGVGVGAGVGVGGAPLTRRVLTCSCTFLLPLFSRFRLKMYITSKLYSFLTIASIHDDTIYSLIPKRSP
jgi:hypothetical protein